MQELGGEVNVVPKIATVWRVRISKTPFLRGSDQLRTNEATTGPRERRDAVSLHHDGRSSIRAKSRQQRTLGIDMRCDFDEYGSSAAVERWYSGRWHSG